MICQSQYFILLVTSDGNYSYELQSVAGEESALMSNILILINSRLDLKLGFSSQRKQATCGRFSARCDKGITQDIPVVHNLFISYVL